MPLGRRRRRSLLPLRSGGQTPGGLNGAVGVTGRCGRAAPVTCGAGLSTQVEFTARPSDRPAVPLPRAPPAWLAGTGRVPGSGWAGDRVPARGHGAERDARASRGGGQGGAAADALLSPVAPKRVSYSIGLFALLLIWPLMKMPFGRIL